MSNNAPTMEKNRILVLGGGVSGLTTAMALSKFAPTHVTPQIDVFEIRQQPGTVGGAINLTPNALRLLDHLGVYRIICDRHYGITVNAVEVFSIHHRNKLAESSFRGRHDEGIGSPPFKVGTCHLS
jgi:salicylate hydroxylase